MVLATASNQKPYLVCAIYLVLLAIGSLGATLFMDNLEHRIEVAHVRSILSVPDTWVISLLYMCCSGSFIGFAFAFGQVLQINFVAAGQSHAQVSLHAAEIAFVGPLLGAVARMVGGKLGDRFGGGHVTLWVVASMIVVGGLLVSVSTQDDLTRGPSDPLTTFTTVGYVAGFKLIPSIFEARSRALDLTDAERRHWTRVRAGSLIGFAGSVGALGGVAVNLALRQSYVSTGTETPAFLIFTVCYLGAAVLTWVRYVRPQRVVASALQTPSNGQKPVDDYPVKAVLPRRGEATEDRMNELVSETSPSH